MATEKSVVKYTLDGSDPGTGKAVPSSGIVVDHSARLRVWAALPGGPPTVKEVAVTVGEVWVGPGGTGPGSWDSPAGSLADGVDKAKAAGVSRIRILAGTLPTQATLAGTWTLSGGWKAPGEVAGAPSVLGGIKQSGSTQKNPVSVIKVDDGATVQVENLEIRAPASSFAAAVSAGQGSTLTVVASRLVGGAGLYGYGLRAAGAKLVSVEDSTLSGGDGGSSFGLSADNSTVRAVRTRFDAGTGNAVSYGLSLTQSKGDLSSCVVYGGSANSSYAVGLYSSQGSRFVGSTILGGSGSSSWAFYLDSSDPEIIGCLIGATGKAKSYGVYANYGKSLPKTLRSNAFFDAATGFLSGPDLGKVTQTLDPSGAFTDASGTPFPGQSHNVLAKPALGPAPDWKTLPTSPEAILTGGEAYGGAADLGVAKGPRTGKSIGAW
jgi:hypothetical protein